MKLQEVACHLADKIRLIGYSISGSNKTLECPPESELLSYAEKRLTPERRAKLEGHMGDCDDCRESLVLFARISGEETENVETIDPSRSDDLIRQQTDRVLAFIALDEENQLPVRARREPVKPERSGFSLSYAQLGFAATLVIVAAVAINYVTMSTEAALAEGRGARQLATKDDRRITPRLSDGFEYSPNSVIRGERKNVVHLDRALNRLKFAEKDSAPVEARQELARVYLSRDEQPKDPARALEILEELSNRPDATPEVLNDLGVAYYQSNRFEDAITAFSKALVEKPDYQEALFNRGLANKDARNYYAARRDFQQFIELSSDENWKQEADEWLKKL